MGWQVIALKSGQLAYLSVDPNSLRKASHFLDTVEMNEGVFYGYISPENRPSTTAIGLFCRMHLGWNRRHPAIRKGVQHISNLGPSDTDMYYNYYAAQLMFQFTGARGRMWVKWNTQLRDYLVTMQGHDGHEEGSWYISDPHGQVGGRLYSTSLAALILEVYYRHMPIFQESATSQ